MDVTTKLPLSMASIIKKPSSKYWFACFRDITGRQHRRSTEETNRKKALEIARHYEMVAQRKLKPRRVRETLSELYREIYGETVPDASVNEYAKNWLEIKGVERKPSTIESYEKSIEKFLEFLGHDAELDISLLTKKHIAAFRNSLAQKVGPGTVNFDLSIIKMLFRTARRDGYILENPAEFVDSVREDRKDFRRPFTIPEIRRILEVADDEWKSLILFGLYTGQRLGDLARLTWDNIDLARGEIRLKTGKTGKRLILPIAEPLRKHLEHLPTLDTPGAPLHPKALGLVVNRKGRTGDLSNQFGDLLSQVGLREKRSHERTGRGRGTRRKQIEVSFHCFRHTAVSLLKDAGIPEAVVMEMVGHDSEQMSAHYTHVGREALEKAAAALPEI
jgi:integrase